MSKSRGRGRRSCGGGGGGGRDGRDDRGRAVSPSPSPEPTRQQREQAAREQRAAQRAADQRQRENAARAAEEALVGVEKRLASDGAARDRRIDGLVADYGFLEGSVHRLRGQVRQQGSQINGLTLAMLVIFFIVSALCGFVYLFYNGRV